MTEGRDWVTWAGLIVVGLVAVVWSFTALTDLARLCGITGQLHLSVVRAEVAWGLPISVDVTAIVATRVWLLRREAAEVLTYARGVAWSALAATIAGNAYHGWLSGGARVDAVIVSAVPAVVIGALAHLAFLAAAGQRLGDSAAPNLQGADASLPLTEGSLPLTEGSVAPQSPSPGPPASSPWAADRAAVPPEVSRARTPDSDTLGHDSDTDQPRVESGPVRLRLAKTETDAAKARRLVAQGASQAELQAELGLPTRHKARTLQEQPERAEELLARWSATP